MHRAILVLLAVAALASACGGGGETEPSTREPEATLTTDTERTPVDRGADTVAKSPARPLTSVEQRRVLSIADRLERAVQRFDRTVASCDGTGACVDRAWAVIATDAEWPLYYLVRMRPRRRSCDALARATALLDGFNLAGRQIDYGPPGETDTSKSNARLALVDTLRPLPSEFRTAAGAPCG